MVLHFNFTHGFMGVTSHYTHTFLFQGNKDVGNVSVLEQQGNNHFLRPKLDASCWRKTIGIGTAKLGHQTTMSAACFLLSWTFLNILELRFCPTAQIGALRTSAYGFPAAIAISNIWATWFETFFWDPDSFVPAAWKILKVVFVSDHFQKIATP